jgi:hypothetical protein
MSPATSEIGTFETSRDVRCLIANGRKADVARTVQFGRERPGTEVAGLGQRPTGCEIVLLPRTGPADLI